MKKGYSLSEIDPHSLSMARAGEAVTFLGRNGHDMELKDALEQFEPGAVLTVESCTIGGWVSYYRFVGEPGIYNTVMFEPVAQAIEAAKPARRETGSTEGESAVVADDAPITGMSDQEGA